MRAFSPARRCDLKTGSCIFIGDSSDDLLSTVAGYQQIRFPKKGHTSGDDLFAI